jgi:hypothetical protein
MPTFTVTNTSQKAISADTARNITVLQNQSDTLIKVRLFRDAPGEGFDLAPKSGNTPGGSIVLTEEEAKSEVWAMHEGSGNKTLYYVAR